MEASGINPYDYEPQRNIPLGVESHGSSSTIVAARMTMSTKSTSMTMWTDSGIRTGVRVKGAPRLAETQ